MQKGVNAKEAKRAIAAKEKAEAASRARWRALLVNSPQAAIMGSKPEAARMLIDMNNGCYRCSFSGERIRSFSWTLRGHELAVKMALEQMWEWESLSPGKLPPAHLDLDVGVA